MRRCLGCQTMIRTGSRCRSCAAAYRVPSGWADEVKARDGYACTVPGCATPFDRVEADHLVPRSRGGAHTPENGRTLCHAHHVAKTNAERLGVA